MLEQKIEDISQGLSRLTDLICLLKPEANARCLPNPEYIDGFDRFRWCLAYEHGALQTTHSIPFYFNPSTQTYSSPVFSQETEDFETALNFISSNIMNKT